MRTTAWLNCYDIKEDIHMMKQQWIKPPMEIRYAEELKALKENDTGPRPLNWQLSPKAVRTFILGSSKEIPYSVEVRVESFKETDSLIRIGAMIYVERESQKGIIIGHQGVALKKVSTESRKALEKFFGKNVWLEIFVKVDKDWRNSKRELDNCGYNPG